MVELSRKLIPLLQSILASLFHPYLITKLSLLSPLTLTLHLSRFSPPSNLNQKIFSLPQPFSQFRLHQGDRESGSLVKTDHCFNLSFFLQSIDSNNRAHNHWFLIVQAEKIDVLQIVVSDEDTCSRNGKPSNPSSLIPSTYCYYFHTLLIPLQELTVP